MDSKNLKDVSTVGNLSPQVFFSVQQMDATPSDLSPMAMHVITRGGDLTGAEEPSMYGSQCASGATSVAAINYVSVMRILTQWNGVSVEQPEDQN